MAATIEAPFTGMFDQAVQSFGEALKAGVKAQEQIASFWADTLSKASTADYQKKARSVFTDTLPVVQKTTDDYVRLVDVNYRKSAEALRKACDGAAGTNPQEFQAKAQGLFDTAVDLVKENTQALTQTNLRVLDAWADVLRQNGAAVATATPKPPVK